MKRFNSNPTGARRHYNLEEYDGKPGVYILRTARGLYVGSSKNLRSRLRQWALLLPGHEFAAYPCTDYREAEQRMIDRIRARGHRVTNIVNAVRAKELPRPPSLKNTLYPKPRHRRVVTVDGITKPFGHWCRETGISIELALVRIKQGGWSEQAAVTTPKNGSRVRT